MMGNAASDHPPLRGQQALICEAWPSREPASRLAMSDGTWRHWRHGDMDREGHRNTEHSMDTVRDKQQESGRQGRQSKKKHKPWVRWNHSQKPSIHGCSFRTTLRTRCGTEPVQACSLQSGLSGRGQTTRKHLDRAMGSGMG